MAKRINTKTYYMYYATANQRVESISSDFPIIPGANETLSTDWFDGTELKPNKRQ